MVVSCVEEKEHYRCHPHKLVGKDGMCKKGVCSMDINTPDMTATFQVKNSTFNNSNILNFFRISSKIKSALINVLSIISEFGYSMRSKEGCSCKSCSA